MSITSISNDTLGRDSFINSQKPVPPTITGYTISVIDDIVLDPAGGQTILINGNGFQRGATVVVDGTTVPVVSFISSNQLSFTSIAKSAGSYAIYVVNADLGTAIYIPGLIYSNLPTWTTGAGSLGSYYETTAISNTVVAGGDEPLTYALVSGTLPSGATLSSGGVITGTSPADTGSTTYTFTVEAIDAQLQSSTRSFSLTINTDVVTWNSPGTNTTVALDGAAHSSILSATSAAGYGVTYAADTLPPGLTLSGDTISGTPTTQDTTVSVLTATANTTGRSATNTITWVVSLGDIYFNLTTLLLSGNANTFVSDASTNRFPVTVVGDTRPSNFSPYLTGWSNQFDGSGDFLSFTGSPGTTLTADFTVEAWIYLNSVSVAQPILCIGDSIANPGILLYFANDSKLSLAYAGARQLTGATSVTANSWNHVAFVRSGSTITAYLNGVSQGTVTNSATFSGTTTVIGREIYNNAVGGQFSGYISNLRIVKGTAVYTNNFTPPTQPLTVIAGTSLLTCADNRFVDDSANNFTITPNGDVAVRSFSPFTESLTTRGSAYFDGTGDYLQTPSSSTTALIGGNISTTSTFTIDAWIYQTQRQTYNNGCMIGDMGTNGSIYWGFGPNATGKLAFNWYDGSSKSAVGDSTIPLNTWTHIALSISTGSIKLFVNGVLQTITGNSTTTNQSGTFGYLLIGSFYTSGSVYGYFGNISNLRIVKGTALYTANFTTPTQPLTAVANTSLLTLQTNNSHTNNQFVDSSGSNLLVTRAGNATQGSFSPYSPSGWSNYFDGSGDYLDLPNNTAFSQTGSWTLECWVYPTAAQNNYLYSQATTNFLQINISGTMYVNIDRSGVGNLIVSTNPISLDTWTHLALVSDGTNMKLFINGTQSGSTAAVGAQATSAAVTRIGAYQATGTLPYAGYVSNLRLVKGTAVYTANFTPSTQPLTAVAGTGLLTCCDNRFVDESPNNFAITRVGDTRITNFAPFKAVVQAPTTYSAYFDGSGDRITSPATFELATNGNWTIEAFINPTSIRAAYILGLGRDTGGTTPYLHISTDSSGRLKVDESSTTTRQWFFDTTQVVPVGVFSHIALVQDGSAIRLYYNGVVVGTATFSSAHQTAMRPWIGEILFSSGAARTDGFIGHISNVRYVNGVSIYSGTSTTTPNFTPPTQPLEAITNTSLLTCQSPSFVDNSTNRFAITATGNTQPTTVNPFGFTFTNSTGYTASEYSGSMYFDGTGDWLTVPYSSAFSLGTTYTVEAWVYPTVLNASNNEIFNILNPTVTNFGGCVFYVNASGVLYFETRPGNGGTNIALNGGTVLLNTWTHVCISVNAGAAKLFVNGTQVDSDTVVALNGTQSHVGIGAFTNGFTAYPWTGYISNLRVVKGTALYTSNFVPPLAPLEPVPNTVLLLNGTGAGIVDATTKNVLETVGDAKISTAVAKFGGSSMRFDGSGDYLVLPANPNFAFGTGNFTVECWVNYVAATNSGIFQIGSSIFPLTNGVGLGLDASSRWMLYYANGSAAGTAFGPANNTWYHVAVVRNSGTTKVYLDGVSVMSVTDTANYTGTFLGIAGIYSTAYLMNGYIQDLRITRGHARYTANFTPPTSAFNTK